VQILRRSRLRQPHKMQRRSVLSAGRPPQPRRVGFSILTVVIFTIPDRARWAIPAAARLRMLQLRDSVLVRFALLLGLGRVFQERGK